jgi:hypothetical protein
METTGKIHVIADTKVVSEKFQSRDCVLVIADNPSYPQYVTFQFTQDKCGLLDLYQAGQEVTVSFNLRGRSWTSPQGETKYFNTIEGWRIVPIAGQTQVPQPPTTTSTASKENVDDGKNDMPF